MKLKFKKKKLSRCCAAQQKNYFFLKKEKEYNINYLNNQYIDMSFNAVCITQSPNARTRLLKLCILNIARTHGCAVRQLLLVLVWVIHIHPKLTWGFLNLV